MKFGNPYILFLLLLIPIFLIYIGIANHRRKKNFEKFAESRFYDFFMQEFSVFHWSLKNIIFVGAIFFMIFAAARPRWNKEVQILKKEGIDIVVCIDVSKSMDAQDIKPSRIERAKDQISLFIDQLKGDRIAIVAFAGRSFVQCPLTDDYGAAKLFLNLLDTETVPSYGTDIGGAIQMAMSLFGEAEKHKVIIVASDGEDLEKQAIKITEEAAKIGAISADHLLMSSINGLKQMAYAGVIGVLLPATPFSLMQEKYAPARKMIEIGVPVALATDLNPNCWTENMQFITQLACLKMRMTPAEAITAATFNAACSIGMNNKVGSLEKEKQADIIILDCPNHKHLPYHLGINLVETVIKKGEIINLSKLQANPPQKYT